MMAKAKGGSDTDDKPQGLVCPRCGCGHLPVQYTRRRTNKIVRVRQCRHCQRRVITHEAIGAWRIAGGDDCREQQRGLAGVFDWSGSEG